MGILEENPQDLRGIKCFVHESLGKQFAVSIRFTMKIAQKLNGEAHIDELDIRNQEEPENFEEWTLKWNW
jgi:hypothetical protein